MDRQRTTVFRLCLLTSAVLALALLGAPPATASPRDELAARHIEFAASAFVEHAGSGDLEVVKLFLASGMDIDAVPDLRKLEERTALIEASAAGRMEMVKFLLAHGASVDKTDEQDQTALISAAAAGQTAIVELLAAHGANVNAKGGYQQTALIYAATFGQAETVRSLLKLGADPNARDSFNGGTAIDHAADPQIVQILRSAGGKKASEMR